MFGRYLMQMGFQNPPTYDGKNLLTTTQAGNLELAQSAVIGDTYIFGPGTVNSFHVTFNRRRDNRGPTDTAINPTLLGINMYSAVPNFLLMSVTGGFSTFCGTCAPGHFNVTSYQLADDLDTGLRGDMSFPLARERRTACKIIRFRALTKTAISLSTGQSSGLGMADFMMGLPSDFYVSNATPDDLRQWLMSFYAQDRIKVSSHLTINLGLRWEPTFADPDKYKRGTSFNLAAFYAGQISTVHPNAPAGLFFPGDSGIPPANWNGKLPNFAPRVGLVWRSSAVLERIRFSVGGKHSVRSKPKPGSTNVKPLTRQPVQPLTWALQAAVSAIRGLAMRAAILIRRMDGPISQPRTAFISTCRSTRNRPMWPTGM